jgi:uncharacterized Fe-S cluster-containing MiaB family protein
MEVEYAEFGPPEAGMATSPECMLRRIGLCNDADRSFFFVSEQAGKVTGYMVLQPTNLTPEECVSWAQATDNGTMESTFSSSGLNLYVVSLAALTPPHASLGTADMLQFESIIQWSKRGGLYLFCSRMPGYRSAYESTAITPEAYWKQTRADGTPLDTMLHYYAGMAGGVAPHKLLIHGFPPDDDSMGHGVLFVLRDPQKALRGIQQHLYGASVSEGVRTERARRNKRPSKPHADERVNHHIGDRRQWWDVEERAFVSLQHLYIPQGCGDWGVRNGTRTDRCKFCGIPTAVQLYRDAFNGGNAIPPDEQVAVFREALQYRSGLVKDLHTLCVFNGGSFLSDSTNPPYVRDQIVQACAEMGIRRLVIESRAEYVTDEALTPILAILSQHAIGLTVRIGVETQDDLLRQQVLHKGHTRPMLRQAVHVARQHGVRTGGYVLLKPAPDPDIRKAMGDRMATKEQINLWAVEEAKRTLDYVLGTSTHDLAMDEAYFCSTNVAPYAPGLKESWDRGEFSPATLTMLYEVLVWGVHRYGARVHLLPFNDEPPLLAIPSNHRPNGIAPDLHDALGCDSKFHAILDAYRNTCNPHVLARPSCDCT